MLFEDRSGVWICDIYTPLLFIENKSGEIENRIM